MAQLCLEVVVQLFGQPENTNRIGAAKGVDKFRVNTETEKKESHGEGGRECGPAREREASQDG